MEEFPPNSKKFKGTGDKKITRVTSAGQRRKPLGKQFARVFFGSDAKSALEYTVANRIIPAAQEMFLDAWTSFMERRIYGDRRSKRFHGTGIMSGTASYNTPYHRVGQENRQTTRMLSRPSRARHSFNDLVIGSRQEAEEVIDRLYDLVSKYDSASVADLYELTGIESSHTDHKWGWTDLRGSTVGRTRQGGYLLELPNPEYFE